jgi:hypothetical protein
MTHNLQQAVKELRDFALAHQHQVPARGYMRRWLIDLIEWEDLEYKKEFPAKKFWLIKRFLWTRYK